ncbi:MAG: integration host factor [Actinobacteria bacterium]|nr:integration host factor [Actinomycetota bacterium]
MSSPPSLSPEQRQAALAKAGEARRVRAEVKNKLKMRIISFDELLVEAETDDIIAKLKVLSVLESLPGVGKVKARRAMDEVGIAQNRRLRGLGSEQRRTLLEQFGVQT